MASVNLLLLHNKIIIEISHLLLYKVVILMHCTMLTSLCRFTLVGQNTVSASLTDRVRKVRVPATEQISVEVGDVLGIFLPRSGYGHVPYTLCSLAYQPEQGMQYISKKSKETATKWKVGKDYAFRGDTGSCKTWSLNAYI